MIEGMGLLEALGRRGQLGTYQDQGRRMTASGSCAMDPDGSFCKLGVLCWGPHMRNPTILCPYSVPLISGESQTKF